MSEIQLSDDLFDRIESYYRTAGALSAKDQAICERWELAFGMLAKHRNKKVALNKYMALMERNGMKLSEATAYRDFVNAEKIFLPLRKYSKEFLRLVIIESAMRDIKKAENLAQGVKDVRKFDQLMMIKDRAEKRIIKAAGLEFNDSNIPDFSKLEFNQVMINVDPQLANMISGLLSKGNVDITQIHHAITGTTQMDNSTAES